MTYDDAFGKIQRYMHLGIESAICQITVSFGMGILFAPWSTGLFLLVLFLLLFELVYCLIVQKFTMEHLLIRLAIVSGYIIGWVLGRLVIGDTSPFRMFYEDGLCKMGRPGHRHPCHYRDRYNNLGSSRIAAGHDMVNYNGHRYVSRPVEITDSEDYHDNLSILDIFDDDWRQISREETVCMAIPHMNRNQSNLLYERLLKCDIDN